MRQVHPSMTHFETRSDDTGMRIEGYFAVFNSDYEIAPGMSESIAPGAFSRTLQDADVRALTNHDTTLVLGRTKAGTLELREDDTGLWGSILVNPNDQDSMNLYARVQRGDVDQCSFGFEIVDEVTERRADGSTHWTIRDVNLFEVSACTFPAYEATNISARSAERDAMRARELAAWKERMRGVLRHGAESADASKEAE